MLRLRRLLAREHASKSIGAVDEANDCASYCACSDTRLSHRRRGPIAALRSQLSIAYVRLIGFDAWCLLC